MKPEQKLSEILQFVARELLLDRDKASDQAFSAAILLAHDGWNRTFGCPPADLRQMLTMFEKDKPDLWSELKFSDQNALIMLAKQIKESQYPKDRRIITACAMVETGNLRVEWISEDDAKKARKPAPSHGRR